MISILKTPGLLLTSLLILSACTPEDSLNPQLAGSYTGKLDVINTAYLYDMGETDQDTMIEDRSWDMEISITFAADSFTAAPLAGTFDATETEVTFDPSVDSCPPTIDCLYPLLPKEWFFRYTLEGDSLRIFFETSYLSVPTGPQNTDSTHSVILYRLAKD